MSFYAYPPYVSVAARRAKAEKEIAKAAKHGHALSPVNISGRNIASTFWGKAWCKHLESYSDYSNRLPRGRSYAKNGSIIDLNIAPSKISAQVMGSALYHQEIHITPLASTRWEAIKKACAGRVDSLIELLQGRLSDAVMAVLTDKQQGMFPAPSEISMRCSCPDSAGLCKHLAAVLYGVGSRLDSQPEILFTLRKADSLELLNEATSVHEMSRSTDLDQDSLADVFGIDIAFSPPSTPPRPAAKPKAALKPPAKPAAAKPAATKPAAANAAATKPAAAKAPATKRPGKASAKNLFPTKTPAPVPKPKAAKKKRKEL